MNFIKSFYKREDVLFEKGTNINWIKFLLIILKFEENLTMVFMPFWCAKLWHLRLLEKPNIIIYVFLKYQALVYLYPFEIPSFSFMPFFYTKFYHLRPFWNVKFWYLRPFEIPNFSHLCPFVIPNFVTWVLFEISNFGTYALLTYQSLSLTPFWNTKLCHLCPFVIQYSCHLRPFGN